MARYDDKKINRFLALWTLAVLSTTASFLYYLSVRVEVMGLGYDLGEAHGELARLREVERVLELEISAHETPERIQFLGRTLFGMEEPPVARAFSAGSDPAEVEESEAESLAGDFR